MHGSCAPSFQSIMKISPYMNRMFCLGALSITFALAACGDDDSHDSPTPAKDGTHLSATLPDQPDVRWSAGSEVRVLSQESILPNRYVCDHSTDGTNAVLTLSEGSADLVTGEAALVAYTPNNNIKGLWVSADNLFTIGQRIPRSYEAAEVGISGKDIPRPVALWAPVSFTQEGLMRAELRHLTALLNIPSSSIPENCRALLLVTHNRFLLNGESVQGGGDEALSGLFEAQLTGSPVLASSGLETTCDTLRINLDPDVVYDSYCIPVLAGTYRNLQVLAITSDHFFAEYDWTGSRLLQFTDKTLKAGVTY